MTSSLWTRSSVPANAAHLVRHDTSMAQQGRLAHYGRWWSPYPCLQGEQSMVAGAFSVGITPTTGITFGQAVLHCATCDPWQCRGVPLGWRLARVDGWHGPAPRAEQAHRERPVTSGAGEGALHRFRWIMAWCTVHLSPAGIAERRRLSRSVDRGPEHSDAGDAGATARGKCGRPDQLSALRARSSSPFRPCCCMRSCGSRRTCCGRPSLG